MLAIATTPAYETIANASLAPDACPPSPRPVRAANTPGKADPDWDVAGTGKARFASIPLTKSDRAPIGTAKPFLPESFASREAEYNWLVATQDLELATVHAELAQTNIDSFSLDQPTLAGLDPDVSDTDTERAACRYGTAYTLPDPDLLRRIEWEKFVSGCSAVLRITLEPTGITIHDARLDPARASSAERREKILAKRAQIETLASERFPEATVGDVDDMIGARNHVRHFRLRVLDYMTAEQRADWLTKGPQRKAYLDQAPAVAETDDTPTYNPEKNTANAELGFDEPGRRNEPGEARLWPLTPREKAWLGAKYPEVPEAELSIDMLPPFSAYLAKSAADHAALWNR